MTTQRQERAANSPCNARTTNLHCRTARNPVLPLPALLAFLLSLWHELLVIVGVAAICALALI